MGSTRRGSFFQRAAAAIACVVTAGATTGCIDRPIAYIAPQTQSGVSVEIENDVIDTVDLLLEIDNSGSMAQNQQNIARQLQPMIERLTSPPDLNRDGRPDYPAVRDLHVGVISSDLGSRGFAVCGQGTGDDGLMNPIRNGAALRTHPPPAEVRPGDCARADQVPAFLAFDSERTDAAQFSQDFRCHATLHTGGCGIEQQLEAVYRALITHDARARVGNIDPNGGFLRERALLAIVLLTDEEDGSVRDCNYAEPGHACSDARTAFDPAASGWSTVGTSELNNRFYLYQPGSAQDPTWPLERYVDPRDPARGLLGLKPGHPERIVFAAIAGVPLALPSRTVGSEVRTDWNALLGEPDPSDPENFNLRRHATAHAGMSAQGPVSMRQAVREDRCGRPVPACRRNLPGVAIDPSNPPCSDTQQYVALPSRRIAEIARRFDESPLCDGGPCRNGLVTSVCSEDYAGAMSAIVGKIQARLARCLPRVLTQRTDPATGERTVQCLVRETLPEGASCDAVPGRTPVANADGSARRDRARDGTLRAVCDIAQVPTGADGAPVSGRSGWFYERLTNDATCHQRIAFTPGAEPPVGSVVRLECIQSVTGVPSGPTQQGAGSGT